MHIVQCIASLSALHKKLKCPREAVCALCIVPQWKHIVHRWVRYIRSWSGPREADPLCLKDPSKRWGKPPTQIFPHSGMLSHLKIIPPKMIAWRYWRIPEQLIDTALVCLIAIANTIGKSHAKRSHCECNFTGWIKVSSVDCLSQSNCCKIRLY